MRRARRDLFIFPLFLIMLLVGCVPGTSTPPAQSTESATSAPTNSPVPTSTWTALPPTLTPTILPSPSPTSVPLPEHPRYTLTVQFFYAERSAQVEEQVEYVNQTGQPLVELPLMAPLLQYRDTLRFRGLWWAGGALDGQPVENAGIENIQVIIPLVQPLQPGEKIGLRIEYDIALPSQSAVGGERPLPIGYTSRQVNLVDWYLFVPPFQPGVGWLAHPPSYYGENLVYELADFKVNLRLAAGRSDLIVAASAAAQTDGEWLRYQAKGARTFALSIGHEYLVETAQVGNVTISSYYFPFNEEAGKKALQTTVESVELFSELFGPYPHATLAVVEADFYDGMEYDGLYFLSRAFYNVHTGDPGDYLVAIAAHETAHQWWYGMVGNDQANEPWLDEALCTYSEYIYYEFYHPESLDWWQKYRIDYYKPSGWVNTSVYNPQGVLQTYQDYRNAVYLNGARFLKDLRQLIGDDAFFEFLGAYARQYAGKIAFQADFFNLLSQYTQAGLGPLKQEYFFQSGQ